MELSLEVMKQLSVIIVVVHQGDPSDYNTSVVHQIDRAGGSPVNAEGLMVAEH